ncbi:ornithine carbamoyltransferase [Limibaculum sp. M0105]|uniref:Ornithine carbamoyltransferase n=1 Tax=Thermohalobaculum xanthum TaxID=2753746 RepID=A0A8J7M823_9RHOB|nr:ornithine carbamoyltransferase [Thermohalobaculum xanthum]MBK0399925.1 ornithine carbamoyltransferase [Thermohalobaculum xanthum]
MTHFLDLDEVPADDLRAILDRSQALKDARAGLPRLTPDAEQPLADRMVALIFEKPSTRTRISFDCGIRQMGGHTMVLSGSELQLGHGETVADTARVLSRYVDAIMIRTFQPETLEEMASAASVPVINGLTNRSHPCQIMADVMTYEEKKGPIRGAKVVWTGDGNNVCASWIHGAQRFGYELVISGPETLDPDPAIVAEARAGGATITFERDAAKAVQGADCVIADTWLSMHDDVAARDRRHNQLKPYQVNAALMARAKPDAIFMHCLPAHREEEVTSEVFDGPQSVVFDEAENRLHVQKGIVRWCLGVL